MQKCTHVENPYSVFQKDIEYLETHGMYLDGVYLTCQVCAIENKVLRCCWNTLYR